MPEPTKKEVVRVESQPGSQAGKSNWKPTPEAKQKATTFRIIALVLWALAIAGEVFAIFWVLKQSTINMVLLIAAIVVIGVLAVIGDLLWKRANLLDPGFQGRARPLLHPEPARRHHRHRRLSAPDHHDLDEQEHGPAAEGHRQRRRRCGVGDRGHHGRFVQPAVCRAVHGRHRRGGRTYTGRNLVFWTKAGTVYHLCDAASDLQQESKDNKIYSGTVADAQAARQERLTLKVEEELKQCGISTPVPGSLPTPKPGDRATAIVARRHVRWCDVISFGQPTW